MQNNESISCEECRSLLFDYVTDNMSEQKKNQVLLHIKSCPECEKEFEEINEILGAAAEISDVEVPASVKESVFAGISAEASDMAKKRTRIYKYAVSTFVPIAACAALAIGIFSGGFYDRISKSENMLSAGIDTAIEEDTDKEYTTQTDNALKEKEEEKITENNIDISDSYQSSNKTSESGSALPENGDAAGKEETANALAVTEAGREPVASGGGSASVQHQEETTESQPFMIAREMADDSGIAVASEEMYEEAAEGRVDIPVSCIVVTDMPADFVSGFGITVDNDADGEISFELSADRWREFVDYNRDYGAELSAEYAENSADIINITVKTE